MLESTWLDEEIAVVSGDKSISGRTRVNWRTIEVTLLSGWPGVNDRISSSPSRQALRMSADPNQAYVHDGRITARGRKKATDLLADLYARCVAIQMNGDEVGAKLDEYRRHIDTFRSLVDEAVELAIKARQPKRPSRPNEAAPSGHAALNRNSSERIGAIRRKAEREAAKKVRDWCAAKLGMPVEVRFLNRWYDTIVCPMDVTGTSH